ncbi:MAG: DUF1003 domain-containing protein [Betaproteobacteria bacterium]
MREREICQSFRAAKHVTPTIPPPEPDSLSSSLKRNIRALEDRRRQQAAAATWEERIAEAITRFTGSMRFVYLHVVLFGAWFLVNLGVNLGVVPGVPRFDPSFVVLAMVASVEAIFLSTFVLISQNRMADAADKRADLDLHISLLTEHELTKLTRLVTTIAERLGAEANADPEINEVTKDAAPEAVLDKIEAQQDPQ